MKNFLCLCCPIYRLWISPPLAAEVREELDNEDMLGEARVALEYGLRTGRDLFADTLVGSLFTAGTIVFVCLSIAFLCWVT